MTTYERSRETIKVLVVCICVSTLAAAAKIYYGYASHSLAFFADGIHSVFDSFSTLVGIFSIYHARKPPDERHPYGHRKFETIAAVFLSFFLVLAAHEVALMSLKRLSQKESLPEFNLWGLVILLGTFAINIGLSRYEARAAKKLRSSFLQTDSAHNQSDFLITFVILISMAASHFRIPYVDSLSSIAITLYLGYLALSLILSNIKPLLDHSVLSPDEVRSAVSEISEVVHCHHIRSRGEIDHHFLDLNIHLPGDLTLDQAHAITHLVEDNLKNRFPGLVDVVIHTEPHNHPPCSVDG